MKTYSKSQYGFTCDVRPVLNLFHCILKSGQKRIDCYWTDSRDDALDWFDERIGVELQMMEEER